MIAVRRLIVDISPWVEGRSQNCSPIDRLREGFQTPAHGASADVGLWPASENLREAACEARADGAYAAAATFGVRLSGGGTQLFDDRARLAPEPDIKLSVDADGR